MRKGSTYEVPGSVKTIGQYAFGCGSPTGQGSKGNPYLKKLVFGKKLEKLDCNALTNCRAEKLFFNGKPPVFEKLALIGAQGAIYYPKKYEKQWKEKFKQLEEEYSQ